jgi:hypothetical protein
MKGNNGKGNIESRDDWRTPQLLFDAPVGTVIIKGVPGE